MQRITTNNSFIPSLIFFFFLGFYLFTTKGVIHIGDGMVNFQTTRSIAEDQTLAISCDIIEHFVVKSPNGRCYSKYDTGLPITAVPLYLLGKTFGGADPVDMYTVSAPKLWASMLGQIATAATCAVLYILCFHISKNELQAFSVAFLYGIATLAWPYAGLFFSQPLIAFLLTLAVTLLVIFPPTRTGAYFGAGLALGWAYLTRLDTLPLTIVIAVYVFYRWKQAEGNGRSLIKNIFLLGTPIFLAILAYIAVNILRTGSLTQVGYANEGWTTPFFTGLYGLLLSPGRGLLFYSPLTLFALIGLVKLWQQGWQAETTLIAGLVIMEIATYAAWWSWDGGKTWGPRFLVPTHALLMVGLLPWISKALPKIPFIIALLLGFVLQIVGVTTEIGIYLARTSFSYEETLFKWQASPILGQFQDLLGLKVSFLLANRGYGLFSTSELFLWLTICMVLMFGSLFLLRIRFSDSSLSIKSATTITNTQNTQESQV
jgi:hypothetical protein